MEPFREPGLAAVQKADALQQENEELREALRVRTEMAASPDRAFAQGWVMACVLVGVVLAVCLVRCAP
jgi:hypothetical protein